MTDTNEITAQRYLDFSCEKIEFTLNPGDSQEGIFEIITTDKEVKGIILSTDTRMRLSTTQFAGERCMISYVFDGTYLETGATVNGKFTVLSTIGEKSLPFEIHVERPCIQGVTGLVKDLFQFTNLAKTDWQEAVHIFYSLDFIQFFVNKNENYLPLYKGLSHVYGNEQNVEEFLIAIHKKTPITFTTDIDSFQLENMVDTTIKTIMIRKSGWGYAKLFVECEGCFISTSVTCLTKDDFEEDVYPLAIKLDAQKLHIGSNVGKIRIFDTRHDIEIPVSVFMKSVADTEETQRRLLQKTNIEMLESYAEMQMHKISKNVWIQKMKERLAQLDGSFEDDIECMLYKTQVLLEEERFNEAKWYLDQIGNRLRREETTPVIKCSYYYLTTLYNQDESYVNSVRDFLNNAYKKNPTQWRIAMFLMNLDETYEKDPEAKWQFLKEQYKLGCVSPVIFSEAVSLILSNHTFIRRLDEFEQQVLWYAAKNDMLTENLMEQVEYMSNRFTEYTTLLFRLCTYIYQKRKSSMSVMAICRLLILGDKRGKEYVSWYLLGIQMDIRLPKLYEYYMNSIDLDEIQEIPKIVLMYFAYQNDLDYERCAYLYAYLLSNVDKYPELVSQYTKAMESFVMDQMKLGHINVDLAYLYENLLVPQMLRDEMAYAFTPLLFMHVIHTDNPNIRSVVAIHHQLKGESSYPVCDGFCQIPVYGDEVQLFLEDAEGNRYVESIPYDNVALMNVQTLLPMLMNYMEGRLSFDIYLCETERSHVSITRENEKRYKKLVESEQVLNSFKQKIRVKLLHYYYDNDLIGELDTYLEEIDAYGMEENERAEFIKFLISRGMFDKAYIWVKQYGMAGVNPKNIARLISKRILSQQYLEDDFLRNVSFYIFRNSKYDEKILRYLELYYVGEIRDCRDVWSAAGNLGIETGHIAQRMLFQMKTTGTTVIELVDILVDYEKFEGHDSDLVEFYYHKIAHDYFVNNYVTDTIFFERLYQRYRKYGELDQIQKLALLQYWSENQQSIDIPRETVIQFVEQLMRQDMYFPFYSVLANVVPQLHYLKNKVFVEYRTNVGKRVKIHYHFDMDCAKDEQTKTVYRVEDMQEMVDGIFVRAFYLFQGESLEYYITEEINGEEELTMSDILLGTMNESSQKGRFSALNDIVVSMSMQDDVTAQLLLEDYVRQDYFVRELFRVM